jgi:hypothetical protein
MCIQFFELSAGVSLTEFFRRRGFENFFLHKFLRCHHLSFLKNNFAVFLKRAINAY